MFLMLRLIAVCGIFSLVSTTLVKFRDCGSVDGSIISVDVNPCPEFPCMFPKGKNASVVITLKSGTEVTTAKTVVHGVIAGIPASFPLQNPDACTEMKCPIASGVQALYKNSIFVQEVFPKIRLVVKWEIVDQNDKDLVCFEIPVQITD